MATTWFSPCPTITLWHITLFVVAFPWPITGLPAFGPVGIEIIINWQYISFLSIYRRCINIRHDMGIPAQGESQSGVKRVTNHWKQPCLIATRSEINGSAFEARFVRHWNSFTFDSMCSERMPPRDLRNVFRRPQAPSIPWVDTTRSLPWSRYLRVNSPELWSTWELWISWALQAAEKKH